MRRLCADRAGVTSLEYALMGLFILVTLAAGVGAYSDRLSDLMAASFRQLAAAM